MSRIRHILHASDFSSASGAALAKAVELAKANRAALTVVHVLTPVVPMVGDGYVLPQTYDKIEAAARAQARKRLDRILTRVKRAGIRAKGLLLTGIPHEQIVRAARSKRANLVVIGTHGRTGLARFFLGSVAARVVTLARCPVLTVRGR